MTFSTPENNRARLAALLRLKAQQACDKRPLSYNQQALLYLHRRAPESSAYNATFVLRIDGVLDVAVLQEAFAEVVRRHAILRTVYTFNEGTASYEILREGRCDFDALHAGGWTESQLEAAIAEQARAPFDLEHGPILRARVFSIDSEHHVLLIAVHHIAIDYWSFVLLMDETEAIYAARTRREPVQLQPVPADYQDYAQWQRDLVTSDSGERLWKFWHDKLGSDLPIVNLSLDHPRPAQQSYRGETFSFEIDSTLARGVEEIARKHRKTPYAVCLAAFFVLLHRWTRQEDLLIASPAAGRSEGKFEQAIGYFVNLICLKASCEGNPTFAAFLDQVADTVVDALEHQDFPFPLLVERLGAPRQPNRAPICDVLFSWDKPHRASRETEQPDAFRYRIQTVEQLDAPYDLILIVFEGSDSFSASFQYNNELFESETIVHLSRQYLSLLKSIVENSEERIASLRLMDEGERGRILTQLAGRRTEYPREAGVGDVFAEQAAARAEAIAVEYGQQRLTYGELERRANQVARYLIRRGLKRGELVGVYLDRSVELIVALLGIVKAGGAYVPLDTGYPAERVGWMVEDTATRWVLTEARLRERVSGAEPVVMDDAGMAEESGEAIRGMAGGGDLAYVMYTSGSTGKPKGVCVPHRAIVRLVRNTDFMELGPEQTFLQFAPVSFDASTLEIWGPLLNGGRLVVYAGGTASLVELGRTIRQHGVNALWLTAGLFRVMIENHAEWLSGVRQLLAGGDALSVAHVEKALRELPECRLINGYGPTENTTFTSCYTVERSRMGQWVTIPIGRPIANTEVYVLDGRGEPVPVGVPGEVYAGGEGLALGYWRRPELTAERFVENPFRAGERMYRTGDLGRWLSDGTIEFLGRTDRQVKVRGYRIEPGEIEVAVREAAGVGECAVVVREDRPGDKRLVAYVVGRGGAEIDRGQLQRQLRERLPEYMVPAAVVVLAAMPLTVNGKLDREALPAPAGAGERAAGESGAAPRGELERQIAAVWAEALGVERVGREENFFEMGGHSLLLIQVHARLAEVLGRELAIVDLFRYPTVSALAGYVSGEGGESGSEAGAREQGRRQSGEREPIAIVAMAGRFPGAGSVEQLWANLRGGVESIRAFTEEELKQAGAGAEIGDADYVKAGTVLEGAELFDAQYFGFNPREAEITDPQHRLFLECAHEALERGGYDPWRYEGRIGVFGGATASSYLSENLGRNEGVKEWAGPLQLLIGNDKDFVPTRVAYKLNLRGPAVNVQTACSTSLVAVHMACESLLRGECEMALAGGVSVRFPQPSGYRYQAEGIMSPDGHCRAFDEEAQGTVGGNGAGVVLLKRLSAAEADGDAIEAVILGSAINNDGANKVGYTAPSVAGQAAVIRAAQAAAGVEAGSIGCIEAHGTGTNLGDPIEIAALKEAFAGVESGQVAVASVKTNLGHLDAAAGVTGLIKAALQVRHGEVVPSLHFRKANPKLGLEGSPFYVNTELRSWTPEGERRAGVSSFGIGGTNAHVVLGEAPARRPVTEGRPWQVLTLSAKTETALETATAQLRAYLGEQETANLADVAWTLQVGRTAHPHRRVALCRGREDALAVLDGQEPQRLWTGLAEGTGRPVVFMFPGGGVQYPNMGRELYETEPVYAAEIDRCARLLEPHIGLDLREMLYPTEERFAEAKVELRQTRLGLPSLFITEYAQAKLMMSFGIRPESMIGHSLGEYVCACLAGVLTLDDALRLVEIRSRLMQTLASGAMITVPLSEAEASAFLLPGLAIAAINGPSLCVISGLEDAIAEAERQLAAKRVEYQRLHIAVASHSPVVEPILDEFEASISRFDLKPPQIPYISNLTGTWATAESVTAPEYWREHLRNTVRFADGIGELLREPSRVFVEVGPGQTLSTLAACHPARIESQTVIRSMRHVHESQSEAGLALGSLGQLWCAGAAVDLDRLYAAHIRNRVQLPTYPFEREAFLIRPEHRRGSKKSTRRSFDDWFFAPVWKQSVPPAMNDLPDQSGRTWLVFVDEQPGGLRITDVLDRLNARVIRVTKGSTFVVHDRCEYSLNPASKNDFHELIAHLQKGGNLPDRMVHCWASGPVTDLRTAKADGFYSLLYLTQELADVASSSSLDMTVVTSAAFSIIGGEHSRPERTLVSGPCKVIPQDIRGGRCRHIDVDAELTSAAAEDVLAEILIGSEDEVVAFRHGDRWVQVYEPQHSNNVNRPVLRKRGVYVITGGTGGMGMEIAEELAARAEARLVLLSRSEFPPREDWARLARHADLDSRTTHLLRRLLDMEAQGAEVHVLTGDVADRSRMEEIFAYVESRLGGVNGVIHAAGLPGGGMIQLKTPEAAEPVLRPKVDGTLVLDSLLAGRNIDFFVLCSSLSSVVGGVGHVDYCAANAFMDAFAQARRTHRAPYTVAVNWNTWQGIGMAKTAEMPEDLRAWKADVHKTGITAVDGRRAFMRILSGRSPQVAVCTLDLPALIADTYAFTPPQAGEQQVTKQERPKPARRRVGGELVLPRNETEQRIASVWQTLLGVEQIGIHDNFFVLGGHSLLGTQVMSRLKDTFNVQLPLRRLFDTPTIAALAEAVAEHKGETAASDDAAVLALLEELDDAGAEAELRKRSAHNGVNQ